MDSIWDNMGGFRRIKPALYLVMTCASLYSATRLIEPLLQLKEKGLGPQGAAGMLQGVLGSKPADGITGLSPAAGSLPDLESLLKDGGVPTAPSDAPPDEPREIVVQDVRYVDSGPRASRDLFSEAMQLQSKGELDLAARLYREILEADPSDTGVHRNLAVLYCQQQRFSEAWKHVHALRDLGRDMPEGFIALLSAEMPDPG